MNVHALANRLVDGALTGGGITLDLDGSESVRGAYLVGGAAPGLVLELNMFEPLWVPVAAWLRAQQTKLAGHVVGSWHDTGDHPYGDQVTHIHFDVVTVIRGDYNPQSHTAEAVREAVVALGKARGEKAVGYIYPTGEYTEVW